MKSHLAHRTNQVSIRNHVSTFVFYALLGKMHAKDSCAIVNQGTFWPSTDATNCSNYSLTIAKSTQPFSSAVIFFFN